MPKKLNIYNNLDEKSLKKVFRILHCKTYLYSASQTINYSIKNMNIIGIIEKGSAQLIKFDYNGNRTIIDELFVGDIFSDKFLPISSNEISVIAINDCQVTFIDYDYLLKSFYINQVVSTFISNVFEIIINKMTILNERIELLTTRSIRNKLLTYFELESKKHNSKSFDLNITYTDLADYLAVDRSAMMRELKSLKDEGFIKDVNKKITILY